MIANFAFIISAAMFIVAIRSLSSPYSAPKGNLIGIFAMLITIGTSLYVFYSPIFWLVLLVIISGAAIGIFSALKIKLTALPQMVALLNGLGGLAAVFIAFTEKTSWFANLSLFIGALTFSGSIVACAKLSGFITTRPLVFKAQKFLNVILLALAIYYCLLYMDSSQILYFIIFAISSLLLGFFLVLPIGGADMPVVVSILNACSGWACIAVGFSIGNYLLIIVGSLVGFGGSILSFIMCKAMNRSLLKVLFRSLKQNSANVTSNEKLAQIGNPIDAAFLMENSHKVIIVPGFGMATSGAQHALKIMADHLLQFGVEIKFAIHPVAGRMPGHMNVLLAEANIDYKDVFELSEVNQEFADTDVAFVIGANDITNPLAHTDSASPLFGMPILEVQKAKTVFFVKRSLAAGYAGIDNPLFYAPNTIMLYGDAKKVVEEINTVLEEQ